MKGLSLMADILSPAQRRTLSARQAFAAKFSSPEEQSAHFRSLARRSHERRLTLSGDEAAALLHFHGLLGSIVDRTQLAEEARPAGKEACHAAS
jgi:hypothetical protein